MAQTLCEMPIIIASISSFTFGQEYEAKIFEYHRDTLPYRILLPKNFNPQNTYPLLIVLHGAGERGNDNESQLVHGSYLFQSEPFRAKYQLGSRLVEPEASDPSGARLSL